jgi:Phage tail sheath C-terminal domain
MPSRAHRRLPGIQFEAPAAPLAEILPRMDIAAFVGFAASGPVHLPVAVESIAAFEGIFGARAPLAWDVGRGETVYGQLAPAVRAFFRGGGRRCWVVRVADAPTFNFFPLAGLARVAGGTMTPAFARSRAAGSWSDALRVAPAIGPLPIAASDFRHDASTATVEAALVASDDLARGDLLRLEFDSGIIAFVAAERLTPFEASPPSPRVHVSVDGQVWWFRPTLAGAPPPSSRVVVYTASVHPTDRNESFASTPVREWTLSNKAGLFALDLQMELEDTPAPGSLVSIDAGAEHLWMTVNDVGILAQQTSGLDRLRLTGRGLWWMRTAPAEALGRIRRCERLSLELWVRSNLEEASRFPDLGLAPAHARYWVDLRDDNERYAPRDGRIVTRRQLWEAPSWPLAGAGPADAVYIPIDVPLAPEHWLGAARQPRTSLERDGLSQFTPALFLDRDLIHTNTETVISTAEHLRYGSALRSHLNGMHGLIGIDEVTILTAPDAAQRGWRRAPVDSPPPPIESKPLPQPDWGAFIDCRTRVIDAPQWVAPISSPPLARIDSGTFTLEWTGAAADLSFVVEEAHAPDWSDAAPITSGPGSSLTLYGRPRGVYYYRVRAVAGDQTSDWSIGLTVVVSGLEQWITLDDNEYAPDTLLGVHRALMRMATARGDCFAVLSLPEHYRAADAIAHVRLLKEPAESRTFSFAAVYYPWGLVRERPGATDLSRVTPDGLAVGLIAKRALTRGAWIAPANDPLPNVLLLTPAVSVDEQVALLDARVNTIVQQPRGCVPIDASTLSDDEQLAPINVRRLLSLLRRLALREGATYVFEPNGDAFRRGVQRGFEGWLTRMFERGAFAGATASSAFRVTTDESVNTPQSVDAGRFIVELRVAPSRPMTFLTVRLVQTSDRTAVSEVV